MKTALIIVDMQRDFCEGGKLAVAGGNAVGERIGNFVVHHANDYDRVVFTKDWHNAWPDTNGGHFSQEPDFVDSWPIHCEANSYGSLFHEALPPVDSDIVFFKGQGSPHYSGFQGRNRRGDSLGLALHSSGIVRLEIVGVAGDYCVRHTALDGIDNGFQVRVLSDMVASVGGPEATEKVLEEVNKIQEDLYAGRSRS